MEGEEGIICYSHGLIVKANKPFWQSTAANATTITGRELEVASQTIITPMLNQVPGVFMHSGALNTNRITIRGIGNRSPFSTNKIRAYLDEIPLTTGSGETTIEDIDLSLVNRVEVVKGPSSSIYGAGLGGMIGLGTKNILAEDNEVRMSSELGSYGLLRGTLSAQIGRADQYALQIGYNNTHSDGYRDNNEYDREGFTAILSAKPSSQSQLTLLANYVDVKAFIPSSLNQDDFQNDPSKAAFTWGRVMGFEDYDRTLLGLSYKTPLFSDKFNNQTSVFTSARENYESRPFNILQEKSVGLGGRTIFNYLAANAFTVAIGTEFYRENYDWQTYETNDGTIGSLLSNNEEVRDYWNLFAQATVNAWEHTTIKLGINYNDTNYDITDRYLIDNDDLSGEYGFDPVLSPSIAITHNLKKSLMPKANLDLNVYAIVAHGFSPPSPEETLTPDGAINPDIQPEMGWNYELGTRGYWNKLSFNISAYTMQIRDLLVARRTDFDQFVGVNAGKSVHNGLELALDYRIYIKEGTIIPFLNYTYSDYKFDEFIDGDDDFSGNKLTGTAPHLLTAGVNATLPKGFYAHANYQFTDAMPMRDDNSIFSESYQLLNAKIGWRKTLNFGLSVDIFMGINNIFDEHYAAMILINAGSFGGAAPRYFYPGLPRNYFGGLRLGYRF